MVLVALVTWSASVHAAETVLATVASKVVPSPVAYAVLAPDGFRSMKDLPLVLNLHGGGGSRDNLVKGKDVWHTWWTDGVVPPAIVVSPSVTARGFYMNFKDGSERWEDFIVDEFIAHIRATYPVSAKAERTFIMGGSMGGMGALRIAFRHPDRFGAVAALEPGIEPILRWQDMRPKHRFWRSDDLFEAAYGKPVDPMYWASNNPATMVQARADELRASRLQIYVEAGDEDQFWLYEGAEFLHRVLWDARIKHEYHLVRGADHVGPSLGERMEEAVLFLFRGLMPREAPSMRLRAAMKVIELQKRKLDEQDHYAEPVGESADSGR